jgi:hypothetical protein
VRSINASRVFFPNLIKRRNAESEKQNANHRIDEKHCVKTFVSTEIKPAAEVKTSKNAMRGLVNSKYAIIFSRTPTALVS